MSWATSVDWTYENTGALSFFLRVSLYWVQTTNFSRLSILFSVKTDLYLFPLSLPERKCSSLLRRGWAVCLSLLQSSQRVQHYPPAIQHWWCHWHGHTGNNDPHTLSHPPIHYFLYRHIKCHFICWSRLSCLSSVSLSDEGTKCLHGCIFPGLIWNFFLFL